MAKSTAGKWVSRVGASGGGKAYKKTRPGNYYGALAVIVILGLSSTVYARYEYQHPAAASTRNGVAPQIGTTWYAALSIQACGKYLPFLSPDKSNKTAGLTILPTNVIRVSPTSAADAGTHATLSQFAAEFPGLIASTSQLSVPTPTGVANPATSYTNGRACPSGKGAKYPGQAGKVIYSYSKYGQMKPKTTNDPSTIKFSQFLHVTMAFEPSGVLPLAPTQVTIDAMTKYAQTTTSTTTASIPVLTTTTVKNATTTTSKSTTTTVKNATTTTSKSTTTTAKGSTTTTPKG